MGVLLSCLRGPVEEDPPGISENEPLLGNNTIDTTDENAVDPSDRQKRMSNLHQIVTSTGSNLIDVGAVAQIESPNGITQKRSASDFKRQLDPETGIVVLASDASHVSKANLNEKDKQVVSKHVGKFVELVSKESNVKPVGKLVQSFSEIQS
ncbi:hypothetical protein CJU89_0230 [Yarrowia sp. B02]|nr:hypothetical protein CJU89_0230 [Yarrowia sp. B02]